MNRAFLAVLLVGLPIIVTPLLVTPPTNSNRNSDENNPSFMQRAQRSFTNLFKVMSAKSMSTNGGANGANNIIGNSGNLLQTYRLNEKLCLTVAQGSVVDFTSTKGAIVNAANEDCLGGGGVDGAITSAGGENLAEDRYNLPKIGNGIRCPTGDAKLTGPGDYGSLGVPFVIHAVGPNYFMFDQENDVETPNSLLRSAYQKSLDCTIGTPIEQVAFALLSAGVFRGEQSLATVLGIGVEAINDWAKDESKSTDSKLEDVVLYAFTQKEAHTLVRVCDIVLGDVARIGAETEEVSENGSDEDKEGGGVDDTCKADESKKEEDTEESDENGSANPAEENKEMKGKDTPTEAEK